MNKQYILYYPPGRTAVCETGLVIDNFEMAIAILKDLTNGVSVCIPHGWRLAEKVNNGFVEIFPNERIPTL